MHGVAGPSVPRTLTQEDPGDNQITLEEVTQMVSQAGPPASLAPRTPAPRAPQSTLTPAGSCPGGSSAGLAPRAHLRPQPNPTSLSMSTGHSYMFFV